MGRHTYGLTRDTRGIWHCDFTVNGKRLQRSSRTDNKAAAQEWAAQLAARYWRETQLGEAPDISWGEAVAAWFVAKGRDGKRDLANDADKARQFVGLGPRLIRSLTSAELNRMLERLQTDRKWSNATRNRHRSFVLGVIGWAERQGYAVPALSLDRRQEPPGRIRWITREEAARLLGELPVHLRRMARFALSTGLRQANVTGLLWSRVDLDRRQAWVHPEAAKAGKLIAVPLNATAIAVLEEARDCPDHGSKVYCFTYQGEPVQQPANHAWLKAVARAGLEDYHWHDMRHTWATWHLMGDPERGIAPTPLAVLQKLGGWADIKMVLRYAHVTEEHAAQYANATEMVA